MKRTLCSLAALTLFLVSAARLAGAEGCDASSFEKSKDTCTVWEVYHHFQEQARADTLESALGATDEDVATANRATTTPDPFASHLHNSYQDFLVPFSFAINKVEESADGQALIIRFNPLRGSSFSVGLTGTAAKPRLDPRIAQAIPEADRMATTESLEKGLNDFDDVTAALAFTVGSRKCDDASKKQCFGRNPETYRDLLSKAMFEIVPIELVSGAEAERLSKPYRRLLKDRKDRELQLKSLDPTEASELYEAAKAYGTADGGDSKAYLETLRQWNVVENLATLIDNQPQISLTASRRDLGRFGGPDESAATIEVEWGLRNLNSIGRICRRSGNPFQQCLAGTLGSHSYDRKGREIAAGGSAEEESFMPTKIASAGSDKFVFTVSYKRLDAFRVSDLGELSVDGFMPLDLPRTSEWMGRLQWGRKLATRVAGAQPRFDLSGEYSHRTEGAETTVDRLVATLTFTVPYGKQLSFPVSLTYANKPEFLIDQKKDLSLHFGISYRLPWETQDGGS